MPRDRRGPRCSTTGCGTLTPASWAARSTSNSSRSESVCRWITPPPARRTSSRSPPASTAHASFDAPPASSAGSEIGPSTASSASRMSAIIAAVIEKRERVRAFMEEHVYPNERALGQEDEAADALVSELQQKAKDAGLWAPHLPPEAGGSGSGFLEYAQLNEEIGRSYHRTADPRLPGAGRRQRRDPPSLRHRGAEAAVPPAARRRRGAFLLRHDRTGGGGVRPDAAARACRARRRRVGDRRAQVVLLGSRRRCVRRRDGRDRARGGAAPARLDDPRPDRHAGLRARAAHPGHGTRRPGLGHALRDALHRRPRPAREHARRAGRRLPDRAEAARAGPDPPRHALARADAARVRADVYARARAGGVRRPARREADDPELDRRVGRRHPGLPADDAAGRASGSTRATRRASRSH